MQNVISFCVFLLFTVSCSKDNSTVKIFKESFVDLSTHRLKTYLSDGNSRYLIIFESGLGDDHAVWQTKKVAEKMSKLMDVLLYDRAGYGQSSIDNKPRNIEKLSTELEALINTYAKSRKVILVGHSIGGSIIRDYAIKNADQVAALLFIDPSHENYNQPSQALEDLIYTSFTDAYGSDFGGTREVKELVEDFAYLAKLSNLPDIPVVVLTSMKSDKTNNTTDQTYKKTRQDWYNAHELLKNGVQEFTHIQTTNSGHYIMIEEPNLVINNLEELIKRLP